MERIAQILSDACGRPIDVESLIATSPYLKHDKLREWMGYMMLRRISQGLEMSAPVATAVMHMRIVREIMDHDHINALFAAERRINPALDAWFQARHVSAYRLADLAKYPQGSFGGRYYRHLVSIEADLHDVNLPLNNDFEYWMIRGLQLHDPEHLLGGGGFNVVGEIMPKVMRWGSLFRHFSPELAGLLNVPTFLSTQAQLSSCMLYRPQAFPQLFERMHRAWLVGNTSGPYFMSRFEDYFHLPIPEARRALDINNVEEIDTTAMSEVLLEELDAA